MGIGMDKLTYDPTSANTLAASSTVGSYTLDSAGVAITSSLISAKQRLDMNSASESATGAAVSTYASLVGGTDGTNLRGLLTDATGKLKVDLFDSAGTGITSTLASGKQGLDVNVISEINVDINGIYDGATNTDPDNVGLIGFVRAATPALSGQTFTFTGGTANSDAVVAANVWGQDVNGFNMLYNGTTWDRWQGTGGSGNVNVTNTITTSDAALANTTIKSSSKSVTSTAANILTTNTANRKYLTFQNLGGSAVFVGDSAVTTSTGLRLSTGAMLEGLRIGAALNVFAATTAGTGDLRILELA